MHLPYAWHPGRGGLLVLVPPACVPIPTAAERADLPPEAAPVIVPHLTLLRGASMAPLLGRVRPAVLDHLPPFPAPTFVPGLFLAERPPHPDKDPPTERRPRRTWFRLVADQGRCHAVLQDIVAELRAASGLDFPHPEPDRCFHLSCWNNRGGEGRRSIGDIGPGDGRRVGARTGGAQSAE